MASGSQILGGVAGAVAGFFISGGNPMGAAVGFSLGMSAAALVDPPKGPTVNGPRLSDLTQQTSTFGTGIGRSRGTDALLGNVIWLENNQIREVVRKKKEGGKGGGGSTTVKSYHYYGTFAVAFTDTPPEGIAAIRRIWIGTDLIYNGESEDFETIIAGGRRMSGNSSKAAAINASISAQRGFRIYPGTDDQMPDPRMEADLGAGNCPAFRGTCYAVLYDWPLEKYGNSIVGAQVKMEIVMSGADENPVLVDTRQIADLPASTTSPAGAAYLLGDDGSGYVCQKVVSGSDVLTYLYTLYSNGRRRQQITMATETDNPIVLGGDIDVPGFVYFTSTSDLLSINDDDIYLMSAGTVNGSSIVLRRGDYLVVTKSTTVPETEIRVYSSAADGGLAATVISSLIYAGKIQLAITDDGTLIGLDDDGVTVIVYDLSDMSVIKTYSLDTSFSFDATAHSSCAYFDGSFFYVLDDSSRALIVLDVEAETEIGRFTMPTVPAAQAPPLCRMVVKYGVIAWFRAGSSADSLMSRIHYFKAPWLASGEVTLASVVSQELYRSELVRAGDLDVTDLESDFVRGYRVAGVKTIRSCIEPLQLAYPFDLVPSGYEIKAVRRGNASALSIPIEHLDAREYGSEIGVQLESGREMDTQLPRQIRIKHIDPLREYEVNEQFSAERLSTAAVDAPVYDMPLVLTPDEGAKIADVLLNVSWVERTECKFRLPPIYLQLEPADVVTVVADYGSFELLIREINYLPTGMLEITARHNSSPSYSSVAVGGSGVDPVATIPLSGNAELFLMDIPAIRNDDDTVAFGAGMASTTDSFVGGVLFRSDDDEQTWRDVQAWTEPTTAGYATNALAVHDGLVIDRTSLLQVELLNGELDSITEAQMMTGLHWCAYGADGRWELMRFADADLQADGSYILSTLLRGLRGSEWTTGLHEVGDAFVYLDDPDTMVVGADIASIGVSKSWRGVTTDQTIDDVLSTRFTYNAVNLMPLSPVHGIAERVTNDWVFTWDKRTRLQGTLWKTGVDLPLGETVESYQLDIMDGADVVRTLTSTAETITYTSAQQVADWGSNQTVITANIYQMSSTVGRGFAHEITG